MIKFKSKIIVTIIVFTIMFMGMQLSVHAANENIEIVQKNVNDYIIYIKDNLNTEFEFAFSNNMDEDKANLEFKKSEKDSAEVNSNNIAYVNISTISMFDNKTYIWVRDKEDNFILEGIEINLKNSISITELSRVSNITKLIPIEIKEETNSKEENGTKITTTIGKVILPETKGNYEYSLIKVSESTDYKELMNLATKISKFNNQTDMHTKVNVYKQINSLISKVTPDKLIKLNENEILQPEDTINGEEYILFINEKNENESKQDIQFLTSYREESEEKIAEKITTKLPVTYDNNVLLVILAILVVIAILVYIRIKSLNKKESNMV